MTGGRVEALEAIVMGSIAITARALAQAAPDLTLLQWRIVAVIGRSPAGISVRDLAKRTDLSSSALSRVLGRLAARGLVSRAQGETDRRLSVATLTEAGAELLDRVIRSRAKVLEDIAASPAMWAGDPLPALAEEFSRYD